MFPTLVLILSLMSFVVLWMGVAAIVPKFSGWEELEDLFPDRPEKTIRTLSFRGFYLGRQKLGASYRGCVTFEVCHTGLRVLVWKIFAPFSHPIFVPWEAMELEPARIFGFAATRIKMGPSPEFWMTMPNSSARDIANASGGSFALPVRG